jgi:purine-binding chemotaxis protein CheW
MNLPGRSLAQSPSLPASGPADAWTETDADTYLVFRLGDITHATRLLDIREVVEFKAPKPLPNTHPSFLGVINIRGEVVGLVDLATLLGGKVPGSSARKILLVVGSEAIPDASAQRGGERSSGPGAVAVVVDSVVSVAHIPETSVDVQSRGQGMHGSFRGVATLPDGSLVTLLDLSMILNASEFGTTRKTMAPHTGARSA